MSDVSFYPDGGRRHDVRGVQRRDYVVCIPRTPQHTPHGVRLVEGDPVKVVCTVEGRAQQAGMFSISGAESKKADAGGGLIEVTPIQIVADEWPGDINSLIWYEGDLYDADGAPVYRRHGSGMSTHVEVRARRVVDHTMTGVPIPEPKPKEGSRTWGM